MSRLDSVLQRHGFANRYFTECLFTVYIYTLYTPMQYCIASGDHTAIYPNPPGDSNLDTAVLSPVVRSFKRIICESKYYYY